jgi:methionine synthase II (cobalamin-independent)
VHAVHESAAVDLLDECVAATGAAAVHCCAADVPWKVLRDSTIEAALVDVSALDPDSLDGLAEFIDSGRTLMLGIVPNATPAQAMSVEQLAQKAAMLTDRLGFARSVLAERIGITPACGLAGATSEWARAAVELAQKAADAIAEDADAI